MAPFSLEHKQHINGQVQQKLREVIESTHVQRGLMRNKTVAKSGKMESHYDSTKQEQRYHASTFIARLDEASCRLSAIARSRLRAASISHKNSGVSLL